MRRATPPESRPNRHPPKRTKHLAAYAGDKAGGTDAEKEIRIFANLCEVSPDVIEGLDMADYRALQKVYEGFLS